MSQVFINKLKFLSSDFQWHDMSGDPREKMKQREFQVISQKQVELMN